VQGLALMISRLALLATQDSLSYYPEISTAVIPGEALFAEDPESRNTVDSS